MSQRRILLYIALDYSFTILRPIQQAAKARGDEVKWFVNGDQVNLDFFAADEQRLTTLDDVVAYKPDAVFVPGNMVPDFIPGIKVQVFHGFNVQKREGGHFKIRDCFDLYCTQGPNTTGPFSALAEKHQYFSVKETGWPAIDTLFAAPPAVNDKPVVLLCSTFSKNLTCAPHLFEQVKKLSEQGNWRWLVQFHPKMDKQIVEQYKSIQHQYLQFIETDNVIPLLQQADVMVCDTSSVMAMFLLLSKPVVTFKTAKPQPYLLDFEQPELLEEHIELALSKPPELMAHIEQFKQETHPYTDGKSGQRVLAAVDELLSGVNVAKKAKPLNIWRKLKMRYKFNYWKF
ncbi:CDP-glycerol glycerophosphotransferase family protein [Colwellia sp. MEBiC06753]